MNRTIALAGVVLFALPAAALAADRLTPSVYAVKINGLSADDGDIFVRDAAGRVYADRDAMVKWRIRSQLIDKADDISFAGMTFHPLDAIPGVTEKIDEAAQSIAITIPAADFQSSELKTEFGTYAPAEHGRLAYLNYNVVDLDGDGAHALDAQFAAGAPLGAGALHTGINYSDSTGYHALALTDYYWELDNQTRMTHLIIGDATTSADVFGRSLLFAGVNYASDFATNPSFTSFPLPQFSGSTALPSAVDIYVNDLATIHRQVQPGAFVLSNIPVIDGDDNVTLVVTDASGQQHVVHTRFYFTRSLLKKHLHQFSYSAGFVNEGFSTSSFSYGPFALDAGERIGVSDAFTAGYDIQHAGGITDFNLTGDTALTSIGAVSLDLAHSEAPHESGEAIKLGIDHSSSKYTYGALLQTNTGGFETPSTLIETGYSPATGGGTLLQLHGSYRLQHGLSLNSSWTDTTIGGQVQQYVTAGVTKYFKGAEYTASAYRRIGNGGYGVTFYATRAVGNGRYLSVQSGTPSLGQNGVTYQRQSSNDSNYGASDTVALYPNGFDAFIDQRNTNGSYDFDLSDDQGRMSLEAELAGGIVFDHGRPLPTEAIGQSYGAAVFPNYPNVPVYVNGQLVGKTNGAGEVAIPNLLPFTPNDVRLDLSGEPLSVGAEQETEKITPFRNAGIAVAFVPTDGAGVMLTLHLPDGKNFPRGAVLRVVGRKQEYPMGYDGRAYVGPLGPGKYHMEGDINGKLCHFDIVAPQAINAIPDLGVLTCE